MIINRNNYNNYFLLYVDGELAPHQMDEVDDFCQKHPDLADELQLLMDTRLDSDDAAFFPAKDALLKMETWDAEALTPIQTSLLELLDGEATHATLAQDVQHQYALQQEWQLLQRSLLPAEHLPATRKMQWIKLLAWDADALTPPQLQLLEALEAGAPVPATMLNDVEMQKEWELLQQTLLAAEPAAAMPHKEKLYRHEEKLAPVRRMGWWRVAAAAAVLAFIGWMLVENMGGQQATNPAAGALSQQTQSAPVIPVATDSAQLTLPAPAKEMPVGQLAVNSQPNRTVVTSALQKEMGVSTTADKSETAREIASFRLDKVAGNALDNDAAHAPQLQLRQRAPFNARKHQDAADIVAVNQTANSQEMLFSQAVVNEDELEDEEYITIAGARVKKQKIRGVFRTVARKVGRSFEKSNVSAAEDASLR